MTTDTELPKSWRQHAAEAIADLPAGHSAVKFINWAVIHIEDCNEHVLSVEKEIVEESDERHRLENVIRGLQASEMFRPDGQWRSEASVDARLQHLVG